MLLGCTAVHGIRCCLTPVFLRMYVCVLDTTVSATKMAELIELLFGMWTLWGWKNHALNWGTDPRREGALFQIIFQHAQTCPQSILSTLFTGGQQSCDLWLPVLQQLATFEVQCQKCTITDGVQLSPYKMEKCPSPCDRMPSCSPAVGDQLINLSLHSPRHSSADAGADCANTALLVGGFVFLSTAVLPPLCDRATWSSWHHQLRTGGFYLTEVLLPACPSK